MKQRWIALTLSAGCDFLLGFFAGLLAGIIVLTSTLENGAILVSLLAFLLLTAMVIALRRLRRIADIAALASTIEPKTLDLRLPVNDLPSEVIPIVNSVNGALARLEQAAESEREFLRRAAHQLRTPLTVMTARLESLEHDETANQLRGDVNHLSRIVGQLLQLREIDSLPEQDGARTNLGAIGDAMLAAMSEAAAARDIQIVLEQPQAPIFVNGDPNVIEVAARNLIENAIEHAPPRSTITLQIDLDGHLKVVDQGPGIAHELTDRIFEPFWSSRSNEGGAGLGLTIVRRIAERCIATVGVDSNQGGGAMFTVSFRPAVAPASDLDEAATEATLPWSIRLQRRAMSTAG